MKFVMPEDGHFVSIIPPRNFNGGETSDVWSMKNYDHADIIICLGTAGATVGVQVEECDDTTPTTSPGLTFYRYYVETTSTGDTPSVYATFSASVGHTMAASANSFMIISVDSSQLTDGYPYMRVTIRNPAAAVMGWAGVVLSGARYAQAQTPTAIT